MASSKRLCDICDLRHISKPAVVWCSECDEGFCTDCSEHHHLAKSTRHHTTNPIENYQKLPGYVLESVQFCQEHDERFTLFCKFHDSPYCRTCSLDKHKQCQGISKIEDVVRNVKTSNAFQETEQSLTELVQNIQKIKQDREDNLESLENSKIQVEKEIKDFRVKINNHFDKLQQQIFKELQEAEETQKKKIQKVVDDLEKMEKDICENNDNLSNIKQYASDLQAYLAMNHIKNEVDKSDALVDSLVKSENLQQSVISLDINAAMINFLSSVKTFGNVGVQTKDSNVVITKKKNQQAQLLVPHLPITIDSITLKLQQTLKVSIKGIEGCCMLPDSRLVFTSYDFLNLPNKLILINNDGTLNTTLILPSGSFDVTYVKHNNCLAVTGGYSYGNSSITFINIKSITIVETIKLSSNIYGIAEKDDTLFFCTDDSINSLNLTNKSVTKFTDVDNCFNTFIEIFGNNLYHSNENTNTITCYDLSGEVKWQFKDERIIKVPYGISVDNQGNVYTAGFRTSNVVVFPPDGQTCKELLSTKDKLEYPCALYYDRSTDILAVSNNSETAFLYKAA